MNENPGLANLQPYPFARLNSLLADVTPAELPHIPLALGEPRHAAPDFVLDALADRTSLERNLGMYPVSRGTEALRQAICDWLHRRFGAQLDAATQVLPVNGTREALFSFAQAVLSGARDSVVMMPNPFYQIYEGAALLAGATPCRIANAPDDDYRQNFAAVPDEIWKATELMYICSPGNPTGRVLNRAELGHLLELADRHDFVIAADECYSELYPDEADPPPGLLEVCREQGRDDFRRCVVFHSLSKRSNLPGLRSGFVAGDASILAKYALYRTYHGCAMGTHQQHASALAWQDETHVIANRALYREKFERVEALLKPQFAVHSPGGGFYHWLPVPFDDTAFARRLFAEQHVTVMPGQFLARDDTTGNPGTNHIRVAWVASVDDCVDAAKRLAAFADTLR